MNLMKHTKEDGVLTGAVVIKHFMAMALVYAIKNSLGRLKREMGHPHHNISNLPVVIFALVMIGLQKLDQLSALGRVHVILTIREQAIISE
jgi:hypothetical protein